MKSFCLDLKNKELWNQYWSRLSENRRDIYFSPDYYEIYEKKGDGIAKCFVFEKGDDFLLYPFLLNDIARYGYVDADLTYYDIEGVYGYNGAVATTNDITFLTNFENQFLEFCQALHIIAEFTRFNPIYENQALFGYLNVVQKNKNVVVDLGLSHEKIWSKSYDCSVRKSINKAKRHNLQTIILSGLEIEGTQYLSQFIDIFHATLDRNAATPSSYFDDAFIKSLICRLGARVLFCFTLLEGRSVSTELVLLSSQVGYSFLGGTLEEAFEFRPNHHLKNTLILRLKEMGCHFYCIGGGKNMDDGIFRYKNTFAVNGVRPFYIGIKIHNEKIYHDVCRRWSLENPEKNAAYHDAFFKYKF